MCIYIYIYTYICVYMYTHMYTHVYMSIYIYIERERELPVALAESWARGGGCDRRARDGQVLVDDPQDLSRDVVHIYIYIYIYVYMYLYIYIYIYVYTHYTHVYVIQALSGQLRIHRASV